MKISAIRNATWVVEVFQKKKKEAPIYGEFPNKSWMHPFVSHQWVQPPLRFAKFTVCVSYIPFSKMLLARISMVYWSVRFKRLKYANVTLEFKLHFWQLYECHHKKYSYLRFAASSHLRNLVVPFSGIIRNRRCRCCIDKYVVIQV